MTSGLPPGAWPGVWDVIVIGTGVGGSTVGHALALAGHKVLFVEKGPADIRADHTVTREIDDPGERLAAGQWPDSITAVVDDRESRFFAPLGCGAGGTSAYFAATLERLERSDIEGSDHPTGGWPVSFDVMSRWYARAERLYRVCGTPDPLASSSNHALLQPPPPSALDAGIATELASAGLHPYRLNVAIGYQPGCGECGGRICPKRCKGDARSICLDPALATGDAALLAGCEVVALGADATSVTGVHCRLDGIDKQLRARIVVVAAGAYRSPALLLASSNRHWPDGLANRSGLVGRNLMFHATEMFALWPRRKASSVGPRKTIGLRDFYRHGGKRLGTLQSTGLSAGEGNILHMLRGRFDRSAFARLSFVRPLLRLPARLQAMLMGDATVMAMIIEDLPSPDNRIVFDPKAPGRIGLEYTIPAELRARTKLARRLVRNAMRGLRAMPLNHDVDLNFGHPCGTCRFGDDPETSVLDRNCKAHGVDNLFVVDSSFMPTSGGANPSLTIAANALRVAAAIDERLTGDPVPVWADTAAG